jgi:putative inorganic carbon (hco3(-)) transporter
MAVETAPALPRRRMADRPGIAAAIGIAALFVALPLAVVAAQRPVTALVAALAIIAVLACVLRVDLALLALVAAAPLESSIPYAESTLSPTKVVGAICFASFALYALAARHKVLLDRTHALVLLLLALALVSTLQAAEMSTAIATTIRYASFVGLFVVVSQFLGDHMLQRRLAWVLSISSTVASALALNRFLVEGRDLVAAPAFGDANDFAFILATTLPFTLWLLREGGLRRLVVLAMIAIISTELVLTFSRGALVGLAAAAVWHFFTERRHLPIILAGGLIVAAGAATLQQSAPPQFASQFEVGLEAKRQVAQTNVDTRLDAWAAAGILATERPLTGVGPGNFQFHYPETAVRIETAGNPVVVHNAYLDIAAELGLIGVVLFSLYLIETFSRLTLSRKRGFGLPGYASAVRSALVVAMVAALFLSEQYYAPFWLLGGIASAMWIAGTRGGGLEAPHKPA